jgi:hypothetical protein
MVKGSDDYAIKLEYSSMKVFEQKVEKISHSAAYLEAEAAHERLKVKGDLDEEEKLEKQIGRCNERTNCDRGTSTDRSNNCCNSFGDGGITLYFISTDFF